MSFLKINQLQVIKEGKTVYNEVFHSGINIIRGDNSSGKSTISNFIFYVLGGEFVDWLPEASSCDYVIAEIEINGSVITIKREIENVQRRSMSIFIGPVLKALSSNYEGWNVYPYNKNDKVESFSQILFKILDFPEISTDNQDSITMNQILRLLYIDQLSSLDNLMRNEDFDSPLIRNAIGNLLLGKYDDSLLKLQIELRQKEKDYGEIKKQVKAIEDVFDNSPFEFRLEVIQKEIEEKRGQLKNVLEALKRPEDVVSTVKDNDTKNEIKKLNENLIKYKHKYHEYLTDVSDIKSNNIDRQEFICVLKNKLDAINESLKSRELLGNFPIQYCPICLEKIDNVVADNHCKLCKNEIKDDLGRSKLLRMKLEIEMQVKESTNILQEKDEKLKLLLLSLKDVERNLRRAQLAYDLFIANTRSSIQNKYDKLLEQKGKLIADLEFLEKQLQLIYSYGEYKGQLAVLDSAKNRLKIEIERLEKLQGLKTVSSYSKIKEYALELLKGDGIYEEKFQNGSNVTIDFAKNAFYLDGRNRFSASSLVLLKNCVRFAIFFASIDLDYFRYPRFILCDNIEDKGMQEDRSKNFQKNIKNLSMSEKFRDKDFQIIITTSMIAEELNVQNYTIGEFYNSENKTLKL